MYERKITQMNEFFDKRTEVCKAQEQALKEDARFDEAVFEKVKANVFEIFKTVLEAGVKTSKGDFTKLEEFFRGKLEQIPENWRVSLRKAEENDDTAKAYMENIKLEVLGEIKATFDEIWGEQA